MNYLFKGGIAPATQTKWLKNILLFPILSTGTLCFHCSTNYLSCSLQQQHLLFFFGIITLSQSNKQL